jgi:hypothetical protein
MFRANVYSLEPLTPVAREAVHDGIGMVTAYMGETVAARELMVRLPFTERGTIDPARIGHSKLDKMVELHLMAVPLDSGESERIGLGALGRGWAYVDTAKNSAEVIRVTAAHEVAHAFGFVAPEAKQADPESPYHCCDGNCIMHKMVTILVADSEHAQQAPQESRRLLNRLQFRRRSTRVAAVTNTPAYSVEKQYDFCLPCKIDLRDKGSQNIAELRHGRIFSWRGVK